MKTIQLFEDLKTGKTNYKEVKFNSTIYTAYQHAKQSGNDLIDFDEVIFEQDVEDIMDFCKENDIKQFTISSTYSSLIETVALFEENGAKLRGLTKTKSYIKDYMTGKPKMIPAFLMVI
ncbi:DUF7698 family protein [Eubacterium maltosivorans]|uniref:DUF7698 family protein n=1 Tax=Eubacterium maltosivorans TaxID=2041044 RepID=UPI00189EE6B2|nr:hypothetical protein [Eubacterium maltosivorans]